MAVLGRAGKGSRFGPTVPGSRAALSTRGRGLPKFKAMAQPIVVTVSHSLGAEEAQRRISGGLERGKSEFGSIFSAFDVTWKANHADVAVVALHQRVTAGLDVFADMVRVEVNLPWYLAPLQSKIAAALQHQGQKTLQIAKG